MRLHSLPARVGPPIALAVSAAVAAAGAAGCTSDATESGSGGGTSSARSVSVKAGDKTCAVSTTTLPAGRHAFAVENTSSQVTEVYVYAAGDQIIGEVENIGPATRRQLIVDLPAGSYQVACKPGMVGSGIRTGLTVHGQPESATSSAPAQAPMVAAVASYRRYVEAETAALVDTTAAFTAAVKAGNADRARALYPAARLHYERIEPIAESFGQLDPVIDMRIDDATDGTPFVGFHRLEQDLWQKKDISSSAATATALEANVRKLRAAIPTVAITPVTMGNGAKSLLDEVAKSKVTGEEERYSRIDLVDFQANVEGSKYAYTTLRPILAQRNPALVSTLDRRFATLLALLETHRATAGSAGSIPGSPFVSYDSLTPAQVKALAVEVDTISEPLGQITGTLAGT